MRRSLSLGSIPLDFQNQNRVISSTNLQTLTIDTKHSLRTWLLADVEQRKKPEATLPLESFNHIAREVICIEKSRQFYCDILGFQVVPRPPFESEGYWLYGYGLSLHLVASRNRRERKELLCTRIKHFSKALPRVDHVAFITRDIKTIQATLDKANVFYKSDCPSEGIEQIFFFDPDGNVLEVSNCAPPVGAVRCIKEVPSSTSIQQELGRQTSVCSAATSHDDEYSHEGEDPIFI